MDVYLRRYGNGKALYMYVAFETVSMFISMYPVHMHNN